VSEWATLATTLGVILAASIPAYLVHRSQRGQRRVDEPQKIIDQIQEERTADREQHERERAHFQQQLSRAFSRIEGLESQNTLLLDYVFQLRYHIATKQEGSPPTLPDGLIVRVHAD
jgi:hypothetical protein